MVGGPGPGTHNRYTWPKVLALISPYVHTSTRLYTPRTCSHQRCTHSQPMLHICLLFTPKCVTFWCENTRSHFSVGKTAFSGIRVQECHSVGFRRRDLPLGYQQDSPARQKSRPSESHLQCVTFAVNRHHKTERARCSLSSRSYLQESERFSDARQKSCPRSGRVLGRRTARQTSATGCG